MGQLHETTLKLVLARPRAVTYVALAQSIREAFPDADPISSAWLEQFATGRIKRPPVDKVETLYRYLSGREIIEQTQPISNQTMGQV